jgi:hypothetical protein
MAAILPTILSLSIARKQATSPLSKKGFFEGFNISFIKRFGSGT